MVKERDHPPAEKDLIMCLKLFTTSILDPSECKRGQNERKGLGGKPTDKEGSSVCSSPRVLDIFFLLL